MTREEFEQYAKENGLIVWSKEMSEKAIKALEQEPKWIPIKTRPLTEAEREELLTEGSDGVEFMYDCPLPDDGQEVLVTGRYGNVETDVFYRDDGCYFETNYDEGDVKAWMPKPKPYKAESNSEMLVCPACGLDVHNDFKTCPRCGADMKGGNERLIDADELLKRIAEKCKTPSLSGDTVNGLCGATAIIYDMLIESGQEKDEDKERD